MQKVPSNMEELNLEFYKADTVLTNYMPLPRPVLGQKLSNTALLLYAALLDRAALSAKNEGYADEHGRVFVIYTIEHLAAAVGKSAATVKVCARELEQTGLIQRKRAAVGKPYRIFLRVPRACFLSPDGRENRPCRGEKAHPGRGGKPALNNLRKQQKDRNLMESYQEGESL